MLCPHSTHTPCPPPNPGAICTYSPRSSPAFPQEAPSGEEGPVGLVSLFSSPPHHVHAAPTPVDSGRGRGRRGPRGGSLGICAGAARHGRLLGGLSCPSVSLCIRVLETSSPGQVCRGTAPSLHAEPAGGWTLASQPPELGETCLCFVNYPASGIVLEPHKRTEAGSSCRCGRPHL